MQDMKILVTADLHYDIARSREPARKLAAEIVAAGGDALVLAGDSAGADVAKLGECLQLFEGFHGLKLLVPGNHCLWCKDDENSLDRYERLIPQVAAGEGFVVLDHQPQVLGVSAVSAARPAGVSPAATTPAAPSGTGLGLVGSIGWYDYSFADASLGIPLAFYEAKLSPGAADYYEEHRHLVHAHREQLTERQLSIGSRWMDGVHVRLGMSDVEFTQMLAQKLRGQLARISPKVTRIAAFVHHLPFGELVPKDRPDRFAFAAAFMGSPAIGEVLLECPKVTCVCCGHSHWPGRTKIGHVNVINIGSTYTEKRLEILEL
jgi:Icc-related predicted phosphoesterase